MRIALTGNPNSGKTTMYNAITGQSEKVGNWAGVTVEKKEHPVKKSYHDGDYEILAVDLPGAYSMSPFTSEESVTSDYVKGENPDVIINIVDGTNLSRSLFFTTQLLELGIPVVVALNKTDINKKKETKISVEGLSEKLGCPVIETVSTSSEGLKEVIAKAVECVGKTQKAPYVEKNTDFSDKKAVKLSDRRRFEFVNRIVKEVEKRKVFTNRQNAQDKVDKLLTNKWLGIPIFAVVMYLVFQISQVWLGTWLAEGGEFFGIETGFRGLVGYIGDFKEVLASWIEGASPFLQALLLEGIVEGVSAVVGFLPLVMVMYFLIALLEDCGYMARATVVLDPIFKKVGLSGKSVIPFVVGTGCAVPGVMASRTIRNERERRATAMLAPFMPCGAKLPLIALFVGAFFPGHGWLATAMYFMGIFIIFLCALLVNKVTAYKAKKSFFIIELPEYKAPSIWNAVKSMCSRGWSYIVKAGTIILVCNFLIYLMQNFNWSFDMIENANESILASISKPIAVILVPIGVISWKLAAAAVTGFIAKECVVGTLATCFAFESMIGEELEIVGEGSAIAASMGITPVAALAFLMFNLFSPPCFAAIGAMNAELKSKKWLFAGVGLQLGVGFTIAFAVYQIGTLVTEGAFGQGFVPGLCAIGVMAAYILYLMSKAEKKLSEESALKKARVK